MILSPSINEAFAGHLEMLEKRAKAHCSVLLLEPGPGLEPKSCLRNSFEVSVADLEDFQSVFFKGRSGI